MNIRGLKVEDNYQWLEQDDDRRLKPGRMRRVGGRASTLDKLAGPCRDRETVDRLVRENFAELFWNWFRDRHFVRAQVSTTKQQQMLVTLASADALKSEKIVLRSEQSSIPRQDRDRLVRFLARRAHMSRCRFRKAEAKTERCMFMRRHRQKR